MKNYLFFSSLLLALLFLPNCSALTGEEVARLPVNEVSVDNNNLIIQETSLDLIKDDEIAIWSDMDIEYEGDVAIRFRIEVLKEGEGFGSLEIDPTDKSITIGEIKTSVMGKTNWKFSGRNHKIAIEEDGNYTFRAILVASENPSLIVKKAEIVLKK